MNIPKINKHSENLALALSMLSYKRAHSINYFSFIPKYAHEILNINKFKAEFYHGSNSYDINKQSLEKCIYFLELEGD